MTLTPDQRLAVEAPGSVCITAGAGTGKTHMLSHRYLHHLQVDGFSPLEMVAATFTDKAAAELRARIRELVGKQMMGAADAVAELEAAQISTIHALAARICREHPEAAQVPPNFQILEERADGDLWLADQLDTALAGLPVAMFETIPFSLLRQALLELMSDPILAERALGQDPDQCGAMLDQAKTEAAKALVSSPEWATIKATLSSHQGTASDAREILRQAALEAMRAIETNDLTGLEAIDQFSFRGGSKKAWSSEDVFEAIKEALSFLRDKLIRPALKETLLGLSLGTADALRGRQLDVLRAAHAQVNGALRAAKREARLLSFADLEVHALEALRHPEVRTYYAERWKVLLIDEFQDTNPVQAEIIEQLAPDARLTIVGDEKQSIYGFRRADVTVFAKFRERIRTGGGRVVTLSETFRTHKPLMDGINDVFREVLGPLSQDLLSSRSEPNAGPHMSLTLVPKDAADKAEGKRRVEARHLARELKRLIGSLTIFDLKKGPRPLEAGDIAILCRTGKPLEGYYEALSAEGIPAVLSRGGNLLETREAQDGLALLGFLAEPWDNLALVALLRSPFFAMSDAVLYQFARGLKGSTWWQALKADRPPELHAAYDILEQLVQATPRETPSRLLQMADRACGYTAILANMPGAARREADWAGFVQFIRGVEGGSQDAFTLMRRLRRQMDTGMEVERPPLEAREAVALMTIHASKGLEWPVVVLPNLSGKPGGQIPRVLFDDRWGVALKLEDADGNVLEPVAYSAIKRERQAREAEEERRIYYVAFTRARDRLILTSPDAPANALKMLMPGIEGAGIAPQDAAFLADDSKPPRLPMPAPMPKPARTLLGMVGSCLTELPVTALGVYAQCPQRFKLAHIDRHPGLSEATTLAAKTGILTHKALEMGITDPALLRRHDPEAPPEVVDEALRLAEVFRQSPVFVDVRDRIEAKEKAIGLSQQGLRLKGYVDAVGPDFVLDFKTDREMIPEHHELQLWAYAKALDRNEAYIAYLRHEHLEHLSASRLATAGKLAEDVLGKIRGGMFAATPGEDACGQCPYGQICAYAVLPPTQADAEADSLA